MPLNPFKEALTKLAGKGIVTGDLGSSEFGDLPAGLRERAFFSARTTNAHYLQEVKDRLEKILQPQTVVRIGDDGIGRNVTEGMNLATARAELKQILSGLSYNPGEKAGTIQDLSSDARLNLLLRTQTEMAQGYGQYLQGQNADVLDAFPAQELFRAEERKEPREWPTRWMQAGGQIFDGGRMIALKNDPIWSAISEFDTPFPPFDFNSGMWVRDVDRAEAESLGLLQPGEEVKPAVEDFNATLQASVRDVDPELLKSLKESLGDQVVIEGDRIRWKEEPKPAPPAPSPEPAPPAPVPEPAPVTPPPAPAPTPAPKAVASQDGVVLRD